MPISVYDIWRQKQQPCFLILTPQLPEVVTWVVKPTIYPEDIKENLVANLSELISLVTTGHIIMARKCPVVFP